MTILSLLLLGGKRDVTRAVYLESSVKFSIRKALSGPNQESVVKFSIRKTEK